MEDIDHHQIAEGQYKPDAAAHLKVSPAAILQGLSTVATLFLQNFYRSCKRPMVVNPCLMEKTGPYLCIHFSKWRSALGEEDVHRGKKPEKRTYKALG